MAKKKVKIDFTIKDKDFNKGFAMQSAFVGILMELQKIAGVVLGPGSNIELIDSVTTESLLQVKAREMTEEEFAAIENQPTTKIVSLQELETIQAEQALLHEKPKLLN